MPDFAIRTSKYQIVLSRRPEPSKHSMQVTDLLLEMVAKAARQDQAFLIDLAALQEKHIQTAKQLLGDGPALNTFAARLLDDMANLKAMLHAISIGLLNIFPPTYSQA